MRYAVAIQATFGFAIETDETDRAAIREEVEKKIKAAFPSARIDRCTVKTVGGNP